MEKLYRPRTVHYTPAALFMTCILSCNTSPKYYQSQHVPFTVTHYKTFARRPLNIFRHKSTVYSEHNFHPKRLFGKKADMNCRRYPGLIGLAGNHSDAVFVSKNLSHIWKLSRFGACAIALSDTCGNLKHRRCFNSACALSTRSSQQVICSVCVHIASY